MDALEFYLNNTIDHLQRENVGRAAYRNRALGVDDVASVRVEFSDAKLNGSLEIDGEQRITLRVDSELTDPFRKTAAGELTILRHKDLAQFVDMTKGEKLEALAPLIGLEVLSDVRTQLVRTIRQLEQDLGEEDRAVQRRRASIEQTLGGGAFSEEQAWDSVNALLGELGIDGSIHNSAALASMLGGASVAQNPARDQELKKLRAAHDAVTAMASLSTDLASVAAFASAFNILAGDPAVLRELQLVEVWEAGRGVVSADWWESDTCPLCGETTDSHRLSERIEHQLRAAADTQKRCEVLEGLRLNARRDVETAEQSLERALRAMVGVEQCAPIAEVARDKLASILGGLQGLVRTQLEPGNTISVGLLEQWRVLVAGAETVRRECRTALGTRIEELSPTALERGRLDAYRKLSSLENDLRHLEHLSRTLKAIDLQVTSMREVLRRFEQRERATVAEVLDRISGNVSSYYRKLHGTERYENVRLDFLPGERGLEFSLEAYGETISPPRLMLSESHLNSLGLCLFLAAAREFNSATRFLVLDDVVNSFDADHRAYLAALLVEEFDDFQVIAFTHDPIWFDILRRTAQRWVVRRIAGWSLDLGVHIAGDLADERRRIEEFLDQGEEGIAGNLTRQLAERRLKRLCRELEVRVQYREGYENERRTAHELFRALRGHCGHRERFQNSDHPVWDQFEASSFLANLASHDQPEMTTFLSTGDLRYALDKLDELESIFRCGQCNKWVWRLRADPNDDRSQCECGSLCI